MFSSSGRTYRYLGRPTLITSGSVTKTFFSGGPYWWGTVNPYIYQFTMPTSDIPLIGCQLSTGAIVELGNMFLVSGTTWQIEVYSLSTSTDYTTLNNATVTAPNVYVFCPYSNADAGAGAGFQLFDAAGNLAFTTKYKPLWIRQVSSYSTVNSSYSGNPGFSWTDLTTYNNGQSVALSTLTTPLIVTPTGSALWLATNLASGEDIYRGSMGWTVSGSNLKRTKYIREHFQRNDPIADDPIALSGDPISAIVVDASML